MCVLVAAAERRVDDRRLRGVCAFSFIFYTGNPLTRKRLQDGSSLTWARCVVKPAVCTLRPLCAPCVNALLCECCYVLPACTRSPCARCCVCTLLCVHVAVCARLSVCMLLCVYSVCARFCILLPVCAFCVCMLLCARCCVMLCVLCVCTLYTLLCYACECTSLPSCAVPGMGTPTANVDWRRAWPRRTMM